MGKKTGNALERIQELQAGKGLGQGKDLVGQLTHQSSGETDFEEIAEKLKERQKTKKFPTLKESDQYVKYTVYVEKPVAEAFQALCLKRGDQRRYANQAIKEFVEKKVKELDL